MCRNRQARNGVPSEVPGSLLKMQQCRAEELETVETRGNGNLQRRADAGSSIPGDSALVGRLERAGGERAWSTWPT